MNLKLFLETLSKEDLISLIERLADEQENVKYFLKNFSKSKSESMYKNKEECKKQEFQKKEQLSENSLPLTSKIIDRFSSVQEKIDLYKSFFSGRQDVFALRWFNAKTQKSGYSPVCGNKWSLGKCDLRKYCINKIISSVRAISTVSYYLSDTLLTKLRHSVIKTLTHCYQSSGTVL